jgi:hypothetical protein
MAESGPGPVVLFGSGETSSSGGHTFEAVAQRLPRPLRIAILETPAGFEPNSADVAGRVAGFLSRRLQNDHPAIDVIPARQRHTPFSPDNPALIRPLLEANLIFLGPGSPTYAVRQLRGSLAWHTLLARHRLGAAIVLASAGTIAASAHALPVYEIYKVGEDVHWRVGLDLFGPFGLALVLIPHWNSTEGGAGLDTSRCFMGQARFAQLQRLLPSGVTVVGIDENTALGIDLDSTQCEVMGGGDVTLIAPRGAPAPIGQQSFPITELGPFRRPERGAGIPAAVWQAALAAQAAPPRVPPRVMALVEERQAARARHDWAAADALRERVAELGWHVMDSPEGPRLEPKGD